MTFSLSKMTSFIVALILCLNSLTALAKTQEEPLLDIASISDRKAITMTSEEADALLTASFALEMVKHAEEKNAEMPRLSDDVKFRRALQQVSQILSRSTHQMMSSILKFMLKYPDFLIFSHVVKLLKYMIFGAMVVSGHALEVTALWPLPLDEGVQLFYLWVKFGGKKLLFLLKHKVTISELSTFRDRIFSEEGQKVNLHLFDDGVSKDLITVSSRTFWQVLTFQKIMPGKSSVLTTEELEDLVHDRNFINTIKNEVFDPYMYQHILIQKIYSQLDTRALLLERLAPLEWKQNDPQLMQDLAGIQFLTHSIDVRLQKMLIGPLINKPQVQWYFPRWEPIYESLQESRKLLTPSNIKEFSKHLWIRQKLRDTVSQLEDLELEMLAAAYKREDLAPHHEKFLKFREQVDQLLEKALQIRHKTEIKLKESLKPPRERAKILARQPT